MACNKVFRMPFKLPRNCSASGMFVMAKVLTCPAIIRKFFFWFYVRVQDSLNTVADATICQLCYHYCRYIKVQF